MKHFLRTVFGLLILSLSAPSVASAQTSSSNAKYSNGYRRAYQRVAAGFYSNSTYEIRGGTLWSWGDNTYGQLGDGTTNPRNTPVQVGTDTKWVSVSAGEAHVLGLKSDGTLWSWGGQYLRPARRRYQYEQKHPRAGGHRHQMGVR